MKTLFFVALLLLSSAAEAQLIKGTVTNARTHEALAFVNIGVVGKALGTVADEQGAYQLAFKEALANEPVRVSSLGFASRTLTLRELAAQPNVALTPETVSLNEVLVPGKTLLRRTHILGNPGNSTNTTNTLSAADLGSQEGLVIKLSRRPTRVLNANFNIAQSSSGTVTFRVNLYRLDAKGRPTDTKLMARDVVVTMPIVKGPVTVDLNAEKLVLNENFFLSVEMVKWENPADAEAQFAFSASIGYSNNEVYTRATSQAPWERISAGAALAGMQPKLSFYVTVND